MDSVAPISILIADEYALVRDGIARLCESTGSFRVISQTANGVEALEQILAFQPALALIDFQVPGLFSLELVRRARDLSMNTRVLLMAAKGDRKMALESLRAGANGFLLKASTGAELFEALNRVISGSIYVSPQLEFEKVFLAPSRRPESADPMEMLSSREYQVFQLLVDGVRAKDIAIRLELSPKTVDTYRASLMRKLGIRDVAGLVKFAIQRDLIST